MVLRLRSEARAVASATPENSPWCAPRTRWRKPPVKSANGQCYCFSTRFVRRHAPNHCNAVTFNPFANEIGLLFDAALTPIDRLVRTPSLTVLGIRDGKRCVVLGARSPNSSPSGSRLSNHRSMPQRGRTGRITQPRTSFPGSAANTSKGSTNLNF